METEAARVFAKAARALLSAGSLDGRRVVTIGEPVELLGLSAKSLLRYCGLREVFRVPIATNRRCRPGEVLAGLDGALAAAREHLSLTQRELGEAIGGVSDETISRIERHEIAGILAKCVPRLATALKMTLEDFKAGYVAPPTRGPAAAKKSAVHHTVSIAEKDPDDRHHEGCAHSRGC